jgi:hypothetical protein
MMMIGWNTRQPKERSTRAIAKCIVGGAAVALLLVLGRNAYSQTPLPAIEGSQNGYVVHHTADLGGRIANVSGSGAMYNTLVNLHSGPRVLGQTFTMKPVDSLKHPLFDRLTAFSSGFGGDPNNFAKLDFSKGKIYEFSSIFRRDRQYFDYDALGNTNVSGLSVPYGMTAGVASGGSLAFPQTTTSALMFNTVRRMTTTDLTLLPLSVVTFHIAYSGGIFQGPTLSPGRSIGKNDSMLAEYQRNGTDDFTGAIDWKPFAHTKLTFEEQIDHYKADSYFTLPASTFTVQEADGTPASLGNWDALANPYTTSACNTASMGTAYTNSTNYTILSAPTSVGGRPIINPACDVVTSYIRSQPTRILYPTEMFRFQSTSIHDIALNGDLRYSVSNANMPNYYENFTGLDGTIRSATFTGAASAQRRVVGLDYGMTWNATRTISLSDQVDFSNVHQPGTSNVTAGVTQNTPALTTGNATINYSGPLVAGAAFSVTGNPNGTALFGYYGQKSLTNTATATWDASSRATLSLSYRYRTRSILQNAGTGANALEVDINQNAGIFNAALRPTTHWEINGTAEVSYDDNAFTPLSPRQLQHYRVHTMYRLRPWATLSGSFNDQERHNNTNNTGTPSITGPLQHVDHTRIVSFGAVLAPTERVGFDFNYSYSDVYTSTNICYLNGASATLPGAASTTSTGAANICPGTPGDWGPVKDFMDAPTQYVSAAVAYTPNKKIHSDIGYRISAVSGNQFFNDAQEVNASLQSAYQSPFVKLAWTLHPGLVWRAEYNYYGYGEGGPSGAPFCSTSTSPTAVVVPCNSPTLAGLPTGLTEPSSGLTAPRNVHANNVTLAIHYEF